MLYAFIVFLFSFSFAADNSIEEVVSWLERQSETRQLVSQARLLAEKEGKSLEKKIQESDRTFLDLSYRRQFLADRPWQVDYQLRWVIHLNISRPLTDVAAELAHEIFHLVKRPHHLLMPLFFQLDQSVYAYFFDTLQGPGGESEALKFECSLRRRWNFSETEDDLYCQKIAEGDISGFFHQGREDIVQALMRWNEQTAHQDANVTNEWLRKIEQASKSELPFLSAATGKTYLQSTWEEFVRSKKEICFFEQRRLEKWLKIGVHKESQQREKLKQHFAHFCRGYYLD